MRNKFGAILKGLLHCIPCGCSMTGTHSSRSGNKRYRYYVCLNAQKRGRDACPSKTLPAGEIEKFVLEQIKQIGCDPLVLAETVQRARVQEQARLAELDSEERRLQRELVNHQQEMNNLLVQPVDAYSRGVATSLLATIHEQMQANERRLAELRRERERLEGELLSDADAANALAAFDPIWAALSLREQSRLLQLLIDRIDYDGRDGTISITFHPSGIKALADRTIDGDAA